VQGLMGLIALYIERETPGLNEHGVRMRFIGRRQAPVPALVLERMDWAEELTRDNDRLDLIIPLNYGGRAEIVDAARCFAGTTEEEFRAHLYAPDMHDPDLVIRTGNEQRLSNYLLWQAADADLVFRRELWPDFDRTAFERVLIEHLHRRRVRRERV
jgi:undecaprenyl diphosphate synthase